MIIFNAFDQDVVHRVEICQPDKEVNICATYITNTRDLFVLVFVYESEQYCLYKIDLDKSNIREVDLADLNISELYRIRDPLLIYKLDQVKHKNFTQMHVRGSSHKENIDFNEELFVLLLHEDELYIWQQDKNQSVNNTLFLLRRISSNRIQAINDSTIYFREDIVA